ncbi:MAG: hypothetical protein WDW36_006428 [Sanguina aurantia]
MKDSSPDGQPAASTATQKPRLSRNAEDNRYMPLDARTWSEGCRMLFPCVVLIIMAIATGALVSFYLIKFQTVMDIDVRDMYFDARITTASANFYHQNFINAQFCCNSDPAVYSACPTDRKAHIQSRQGQPPFCQPTVLMQCDDVLSTACNRTRVALYQAAGLGPGGEYRDCRLAGRVLVGANSGAGSEPITLLVSYNGTTQRDTLIIPDPFNINATAVAEFVAGVAARYSDPGFVQPSHHLGSLVTISSAGVPLGVGGYGSGQDPTNTVGARWPNALFPFPGGGNDCPNTSTVDALFLSGSTNITFPRFVVQSPQSWLVSLGIVNDTIQVPLYRVSTVDPGQLVDESSQGMLQLAVLTGVQVDIGMVGLLGACHGWLIDPPSLKLTFRTVSTSTLDLLGDGTPFLKGEVQRVLNVTVRDVAAPGPVALPSYEGLIFIFVALGMGFVWLVSISFLVCVQPLIWWNVRKNRGLPPIVYRYMAKYRGW